MQDPMKSYLISIGLRTYLCLAEYYGVATKAIQLSQHGVTSRLIVLSKLPSGTMLLVFELIWRTVRQKRFAQYRQILHFIVPCNFGARNPENTSVCFSFTLITVMNLSSNLNSIQTYTAVT